MRALATLISGVLFGLGLSYSGMIRPETVLAFLTFDDLGLLLVLGVAVVIALLVYQFVPRVRRVPLLGGVFEQRPFALTRQAVLGGVLFGLGWGICGVCPAPAFAGLGTGNTRMLIVLLAIFVGAGAHGWWAQRQTDNKESTAS